MAFKCGFFNSVNGDRKYNAEDMNNPYKGIVSNGVIAKTDDSDSFQVQSVSGMEIVVKMGYGIFADKWAILDADEPLTVATPHVTLGRIDSVIVRIDKSEDVRNGSIQYVQGEPSENPVPTALTRNSTITEYRLCNITVNANATQITQGEIEDTRPTNECGFVTNLLQDSDITATFRGWETQFRNAYQSWEDEFCDWFNHLRETITTVTTIDEFSQVYRATEENQTVIPINLERFNSQIDILHVFINGMMIFEGTHYSVNGYESITLNEGVDIGTEVSFLLYKSVDIEGVETVLEQVDDLYDKSFYTYVVNSDQKLLDWANAVEGNDYSVVLIKKGTWNSTKGVNLTTAGTKVVIGQPDSLLKFTFSGESSDRSAISYESVPESPDYYMTGVNINVSYSYAKSSLYGFYNCSNLTNCTCEATSEESNVYTFYNCKNLTNCKGLGTGSTKVYTFHNCNNLTNCVGTIVDSAGSSYGFHSCNYLTNCSSTNSIVGFYECYYLFDCKASSYTNAYLNCEVVTRCLGKSNTSGRAFTSCKAVSYSWGEMLSCVAGFYSGDVGIDSAGGFNNPIAWTGE